MMSESAITAGLVAIIMGLIKVIEFTIKKYNEKNGNIPKTSLHPEQSRQLREMHEKSILFERDLSDMKKDSSRIADAMTKLADCMKAVSETNKNVAAVIEKIDRRQEVEDEIRRRQILNPPIAKVD